MRRSTLVAANHGTLARSSSLASTALRSQRHYRSARVRVADTVVRCIRTRVRYGSRVRYRRHRLESELDGVKLETGTDDV